MKTIIDSIFDIQTDHDFERVAIEVFRYQYENIEVYKKFVDGINCPFPTCSDEIPFLPISAFKNHEVCIHSASTQKVFQSSGTTGFNRSKHFVQDLGLYERSFRKTYQNQIGAPKGQIIIALLPNYLDQGDSSLVYMVENLISDSEDENSGFYLDKIDELAGKVKALKASGKQIVLFGVSYALLDLAELQPDLSGVTIIETGGMKGRRKEMLKEELHEVLSNAFNVKHISSEYGMTELLSQAYLDKEGGFKTPPWMKVLIREVNDPGSYLKNEKTGGINVIDLANFHSCSFIATQDLGKLTENGFKIMGRYDNADIRGCNLLVN